MNKSEPDLKSIRAKLQSQIPAQSPSNGAFPGIDWDSPYPASSYGAHKATQLKGTVATLQQRSTAQDAPIPLNNPPSLASEQIQEQLIHKLSLHRERLLRKAQEINALSAQQERAMSEMKDVVDRWHHELEARMASSPQIFQRAIEPLFEEFLCDYAPATIAWAEIDGKGNISLAQRPVNFGQSSKDANLLAQKLRQHHHSKHPQENSSLQEYQLFWEEPLLVLRSLVRRARNIFRTNFNHRSKGVMAPRRSSRLTLIDCIIWLISGVFSRVGLNFLLSIYPGLWSVAVAIVTAITAYALYRATLAPKLDFGLAYRVLLMVAGLIIGGRL